MTRRCRDCPIRYGDCGDASCDYPKCDAGIIEQLQARVVRLENIVGEQVSRYGCQKKDYALVDECYENWINRAAPPEEKEDAADAAIRVFKDHYPKKEKGGV